MVEPILPIKPVIQQALLECARYELVGGASPTILNTVESVVAYNTKDTDPYSQYNTGSSLWTCSRSGGLYEVSAYVGVQIANAPARGFVSLNCYKNGTLFAEFCRLVAWAAVVPSTTYSLFGSTCIPCLGGDTLQFKVNNQMGVSINILTNASSPNPYTYCSFARLGRIA